MVAFSGTQWDHRAFSANLKVKSVQRLIRYLANSSYPDFFFWSQKMLQKKTVSRITVEHLVKNFSPEYKTSFTSAKNDNKITNRKTNVKSNKVKSLF